MTDRPSHRSPIFGPTDGRRKARDEAREGSGSPRSAPIENQPMPNLEESLALLERHKAGDAEALQQLLERYQDRLRRIVRIRLAGGMRDHLESMDIVQEANMVMMRKLRDLEVRDSASIIHWLSEVVLNKIRNHHKHLHALKRDVGRNLAFELEVDGELTSFCLPAEDRELLPPDQAWKSEVRDVLDDAMGQLPEKYRNAILLRDYSGGSFDYVARELGCPTAAAAEQVHRRAWAQLRRLARPRFWKGDQDA